MQKYGANALEEKEESFTHKLVHAFMGPIEYMIEAAAIISAIIGHWDDFIIIMLLLIFNVTIDLWQSQKASSALAALKKGIAPKPTPYGTVSTKRSTLPPWCLATSSRSG
ncbi:cation-transporting P-type ATPase [Limosilactobacillus fermentum]|uniref:cation-transporting P-type ATPase n=1 Tax=Limosilactobacillus fermentum TaxID=1613 RepID=UPI0021CB9178|nr:cation-transporting P-type ATPase [Limosilactobacillus fermentum]